MAGLKPHRVNEKDDAYDVDVIGQTQPAVQCSEEHPDEKDSRNSQFQTGNADIAEEVS